MTGFILGEKKQVEQVFDEQGRRIAVTYIKTSPCYLIDIKTPQRDGYFSVLLGFGEAKKNKKPIQGKINKAGIKTPLRFLKEVRLDKIPGFEAEILIEKEGRSGLNIGDKEIFIGQEIKPTLVFEKGAVVNVSGVSKGKGFQGVVKRHRFAGGPRTHGQSDRERAPGSIGQTTTPGRVFKGKKMAGRMGSETVTIKNLTVFQVKDDQLLVRGLTPGARGGLLIVRSAKLKTRLDVVKN